MDRLTIALPVDRGPVNLFTSPSLPDGIIELVYDKLLAPSPYVEEPGPWLAEKASMIDPSTWEVKVRSDVLWHDGKPFTADDVRFTFEYFRDERAVTGRYTHHVSEVPQVARVETIDETTVRFHCAYACPDLGPITLADLPIVPKHVWENVAEPRKVASLPVGTGPYKLVEYSAATGYKFVANDKYFAGKPLVGELLMPVIPEPTTTFTALKTGEIDAAIRPLPPELIEEFSGISGIGTIAPAPLEFPELRMNYERFPISSPEVRKALSLATDRKELLEVVYLGRGRAADKGYPHPDSPWTNPDLETPYKPDEARKVLESAGFTDRNGDGTREAADGKPLAFTIKVAGNEPVEGRAAELLAEQFKEVGVAAEVVRADAGTILSLFTSRDFDTYVNLITAHGVADPTQFIMSHRSGYLWKSPTLPYPEWDALFEKWKQTDTIDARTQVLFDMQTLFNAQPTSIPLVYPEDRYAFRTEAFNGWAESPGFGIVHKWSFLPSKVRERAKAVVES